MEIDWPVMERAPSPMSHISAATTSSTSMIRPCGLSRVSCARASNCCWMTRWVGWRACLAAGADAFAPLADAADVRGGRVYVIRDITERVLADRVRTEVQARDRELANPFTKDLQIAAIRDTRSYVGDKLMRVAPPHRLLDRFFGAAIGDERQTQQRVRLGVVRVDLHRLSRDFERKGSSRYRNDPRPILAGQADQKRAEEAGDLIVAEKEPDATVGDLLEGRAKAPDGITFFKSVGISSQDVAAAMATLDEATRRGLGTEV